MSIAQRLLGIPFVYDHVRPFVIGGLDWSPLYRLLDAQPDDVVLDVGCGTGIALQYLQGFARYHGFDTDPVAISHAIHRHDRRANVRFECRPVGADDVATLRPDRIVLSGLLHHLADHDAQGLLSMCRSVSSVRRIATSDVVWLPGERISNFLARLDRGKHVRDRDGYRSLVENAGLRIVSEQTVRCHPRHGLAIYLMLALER